MLGGAEIRKFWPLLKSEGKVNLKYVRGQNMIIQRQRSKLEGTSTDENRNCAILCGEYVVPCANGEVSIIGATHEYDESLLTSEPNPATAFSLLQPKMKKMLDSRDIPQSLSSNSHRAVCGNRVISPRTHLGRLPMVGNVCDDIWLVTGMGSRGLLHHAYVGKILSAAIVRQEAIPIEIDCNERL